MFRILSFDRVSRKEMMMMRMLMSVGVFYP
jgi:hypothetical protein